MSKTNIVVSSKLLKMPTILNVMQTNSINIIIWQKKWRNLGYRFNKHVRSPTLEFSGCYFMYQALQGWKTRTQCMILPYSEQSQALVYCLVC